MLLVAKFESEEANRHEEWAFPLPQGHARAGIHIEAGRGMLTFVATLAKNTRYIEPRAFSALGNLAFWDVPEIKGTKSSLRLTAVPNEWIEAWPRVISLLGQIGLKATLIDGTLQIDHSSAPPSRLIKRVALALFALDAFSRSGLSKTYISQLRVAAVKEFRNSGGELLDFLDDSTGALALRNFLSPSSRNRINRPSARDVASDNCPPEIALGSFGKTITVDAQQWSATRDTFAYWTIDPEWLIYLPPGMCSLQSSEVEGPLEHPASALEYYRNERFDRAVVEFKHMGSRAIVIVCKDDGVAKRLFGRGELGAIYSRSGRPFFDDPSEPLKSIRDALTRANFWQKFRTNWVCLDGEYLPWTLKAHHLLEVTHGRLLQNGVRFFDEMNANRTAFSDDSINWRQQEECFERYKVLLDRYRAQRGEAPRFAPFQIIATEGRDYFDKSQLWHMEVLHCLVRDAEGGPLTATAFKSVALDDRESFRECLGWWDELCDSGDEGLVIKAPDCMPRGRREFAQPAIKCRTPEHLRLVYGPEYTLPENRWRLASRDAVARRRFKHRRVIKQNMLTVDGVKQFLLGASPSVVQQHARLLLSLEQEPDTTELSAY